MTPEQWRNMVNVSSAASGVSAALNIVAENETDMVSKRLLDSAGLAITMLINGLIDTLGHRQKEIDAAILRNDPPRAIGFRELAVIRMPDIDKIT